MCLGLKGANVEGTKEVVKIVCEGRPKFLHYVSTMGVFSGQSREEEITEDTLPNKERYCSFGMGEICS